ncbi:hypothetical protein AB0M22_09375 [Nocardia sp. NPDC051756]|uniref:hypothetical protein n=1 Tax=Nocardia sp. NPDC051756 TaxID=3154751 RepID=UPI0034308366
MKHLWEYDHPYKCHEGNYLYAPYLHEADGIVVHEEVPSWAAFKADDNSFYAADRDYNLLYRWDWTAWHLEFPQFYPDEQGRTEHHELKLYFMLQRKAFCRSLYVNVTEADEPEVRAWLTECAETVRALWEPILLAEVTP